ncbi:hypothetical protein KM043_008360 [Ampulex compressa]|nr:hypothetical protein KM043_008360 [Ampulex compressa]
MFPKEWRSEREESPGLRTSSTPPSALSSFFTAHFRPLPTSLPRQGLVPAGIGDLRFTRSVLSARRKKQMNEPPRAARGGGPEEIHWLLLSHFFEPTSSPPLFTARTTPSKRDDREDPPFSTSSPSSCVGHRLAVYSPAADKFRANGKKTASEVWNFLPRSPRVTLDTRAPTLFAMPLMPIRGQRRVMEIEWP